MPKGVPRRRSYNVGEIHATIRRLFCWLFAREHRPASGANMVSGLEIIALGLALGAATWLMWRQRAGVVGAILVVGVLTASVVGFATKHAQIATRTGNQAELLREVPTLERSAESFVGSATCQSCHPKEYATWHDSFHRTMTQLATPDAVLGDFDDVQLQEGEYVYNLSQAEDGFFVEMVDFESERRRAKRGLDPIPMGSRPRARKRIVMTTGSHYMQTYWYPSDEGNELLNLPFVYLFEEARWVPRAEVFLRPPNAGPMRQRWNDNCLGCHATFGQPKQSEDGWNTAVAELGIACEACHGPAEAHVTLHRDPFERYLGHLGEQVADATIVNPRRLPAARASEVCGQCHSKSFVNDHEAFNANGLAYRPGGELSTSKTVVLPRSDPDHPWLVESMQRDPQFLEQFFWSDGMVRVSGREYNGMVESACYQQSGEFSCLSCHALHGDEPVMHPREGGSGDPACAQCHQEIAANIESHSHHLAESAGSSCVNCHMPYTSYGLMRALRSHLIDSPTVAASLTTGRPNACNQCHLDKSLAWAADTLSSWYGIRTPTFDADDTAASVVWLLEGDAVQRALMAWSYGWEPAQTASGTAWLAAILAPLLKDPYATVRYIAGKSLRTLPGYEDFEYDFLGDDPASAVTRAYGGWQGAGVTADPATLMTGSGVDGPALRKHLGARDNRPVDLKE